MRSRSHGSPTSSGRRRSLANRSSADGQPRLVGAGPGGEEHAGVDQRAVGVVRDELAEALRAVALEQRGEQAPRRPPVRASALRRQGRGPQAPLLDEDSRARARPPLDRPQVGAARCARQPAARRPGRWRAPAARPAARGRQRRRRRGVTAGRPHRPQRRAPRRQQQDVQRRVDVEGEVAPRTEVPDRHAGDLGQPARQHVVAREVVGQVPQGVRGAGDGDARRRRRRCSRGPRARRRGPHRRTRGGPRRLASGIDPAPRTTIPPVPWSRTRRRSRVPNGVSSGSSRWTTTASAPASAKRAACRTASAPRIASRCVSSGPAACAAAGARMRTVTGTGTARV